MGIGDVEKEGLGTGNARAAEALITPAMDRHNGRIIIFSALLHYFASPVIYLGIVQAALCDRLGASATVSNLPSSAYLLAAAAPIFLSWLVPHRLVRATVVAASLATSLVLCTVLLVLVLPLPDPVRLWAVVAQGLAQGFSSNIAHVYSHQCMKRGTTLEGRARALKWAFSLSPMAGVAGSLWAQFLLDGGIGGLLFPHEFALLYLTAIPCMVAVAILNSRYQLLPIQEERHPPLLPYLWRSIQSYWSVRLLLLVWFAYLFWYLTINIMPNLALYAREALGREPQELSGWMMALRFGFKCLGGLLLGVISIRWGFRAPLFACVFLVGSAVLWAWLVPGHLYLLAFGIMGAGELGGVYFPNYVISISSASAATRNLAILSLVTPVSSIGPALHGGLTDLHGFSASFAFGLSAAVLALILLRQLSSKPAQGN